MPQCAIEDENNFPAETEGLWLLVYLHYLTQEDKEK